MCVHVYYACAWIVYGAALMLMIVSVCLRSGSSSDLGRIQEQKNTRTQIAAYIGFDDNDDSDVHTLFPMHIPL